MGARRLGAILGTLTVVGVVLAGTVPALAVPTSSFTSVSVAAQDQHDVAVTFSESGLASFQTATERVQAQAKDSYACYDATGKRAGSAGFVERSSNQNDFQANAEGTIDSATITTSGTPLDVCPRGEISYLYKTVFGRLLLTDLTDGASVRVHGRFTSCSPADCVPPAHL